MIAGLLGSQATHAEVSRFLWSDPERWQGISLEAAAHGDGTTVAVGQSGVCFMTMDGVAWRPVDVSTEESLYGVAYGNQRWVIVGDRGTSLVSTDGVNWMAGDGLGAHLQAVVHDGTHFLAVGERGRILRSIDGLSWTEDATPNSTDLMGVATNGTVSVATGRYGTIFRKEAGGPWTSVSHGLTTVTLSSVIWTGEDFLAGGSLGTVLQSGDGASWSVAVQVGASTVVYGMASGAEGVVLTTSYGSLCVRESGSWTNKAPSEQPYLSSTNQIVWDGQQYIILGGAGNVYRTSDFETWAVQPWDTFIHIEDIAESNGDVIAITSVGSIARRGSGDEWIHQMLGNGEPLQAITHADGLWTIYGDVVYESVDGQAWTSVPSVNDRRVREMVAVPGGGYIVAAEGDIYWSETGRSDEPWLVDYNHGYGTYLVGVVSGNSQYLAYGAYGVLLQSTTGRSWNQVGSPTTERINGAVFAQGRFIIGCGDGSIWSSSDLVTWTEEESRTNRGINGMRAFGDTVYAFGYHGLVLRSLSQNAWQHLTQTDADSVDYAAIAYANGRYVAVGENGAILESDDGVSFQRMRSPNTTRDWTSVAGNANGDQWVATSSLGVYAWSVGNGLWQLVSLLDLPTAPGVATPMADVVYGHGRFVAVGEAGVIGWSSDGTNWQRGVFGDGRSFVDVCSWPEGFAAIASDGSIYLSADGSSWAYAARPSVFAALAIEWNGSQFLAGYSSSIAFASSNGIDWDALPRAPWSSSPIRLSSIDGFFYAPWSSEIHRTVDGQTWEDPVPGASAVYSVAGTPEHLVAVGKYGGLRVADVVTIKEQPQSQVVDGQTPVTLEVLANGTPTLSYQWYEGPSGDTSQPLVGKTNATLHFESLASSKQFWVRISGGRAKADSVAAQIDVIPPPQITTEPSDVSILAGTTTTLAVEASGTGPLSYQWYEGTQGDESAPVGADSSEFVTAPVTASTAFWVKVSNPGGSVSSQTAWVTVLVPPTILEDPESVTIILGNPAVLSVSAAGSAPLAYQWYQGATGDRTQPVSGASSSVLEILNLTETTAYWVEVSNTAGLIASQSATVTVLEPPAISKQPLNQTILSGESVALSVEATGTAPLNFQWYAGPSGDASQPIASATEATWASPVLTGSGIYAYWVRVWNAAGTTNSTAAAVTVRAVPTITSQPGDLVIGRGDTVTLSVSASGTAPLSYQWYEGLSGDTSSPVAGASTDTLLTREIEEDTAFWVRVTNVVGSEDSQPARLTVLDRPVITTHPQSVSVVEGDSAHLDVTANGSEPLSFQWYRGLSGDTRSPVAAGTAKALSVVPDADSTYWVRVANAVGSVDSDAAAVTILRYPTVVLTAAASSVGEGETVLLTTEAGGTGPHTYEWFLGSSGDTRTRIEAATASSFTTFPLISDVSIWVRVSNVVGSVDSDAVAISVEPPLAIVSQTRSGIVEFGQSVELSVVAEGSLPIQYQWYEGEAGDTSQPMPGGSSATHVVENTMALRAYWVRVSNGSGQVDSETIRMRPYHSHQNWSWSTPRPSGSPLRDAIWFQGRYYISGTFGAILSSVDGTEWVSEFSGTDEAINSLAKSPDHLIAVGDTNTLLITKDGTLWIPVNTGFGGDYLDVMWDGERFIVTTTSERILLSEDGYYWTSQNLDPGDGDWELRAIASNGEGYVLVGGRPPNSILDHGFLFTSTDGSSWVENTSLDFNEVYDVIWTGERFIVCGSAGAIYTSPDGQIWTQQTTPNGRHCHALVQGENSVLALGTGGGIWRSVDGGITWSESATGVPQTQMGGVWGPDGYVVVLDRDPYDSQALRGGILTSSDGAEWISQQSGFSDNLTGICIGPQGFRAVAEDGGIFTSTDGHSWSLQTAMALNSWKGVIHTGSEYIAYGSWGKVARSGDGNTWTVETPGPSSGYNDACVVGGVPYLVTGTLVVRLTPAGDWEVIETGAPRSLYGIAHGNGRFTAVGFSGVLMTSLDGVAWEELNSATTNTLQDVTWGDNGFVAVGTLRTVSVSSIVFSPDGVTWWPGDDGALDFEFKNSVIWDGTQYVVVCERGYVGTSETGLRWTLSRVPTDEFLRGLVASGRSIFAVGDSGTVVNSQMLFVTKHPEDQFITVGQSALLEVLAVGGSGAAYQWYSGVSGDTSSPLLGATTPAFVTDPLEGSMDFWVRVSRGSEFVDSRTAHVNVSPVAAMPTIQVTSPDVVVDTGTDATIAIEYSGYPRPSLVWQRKTWNGSEWQWIDHLALAAMSGSTETETLVLPNVGPDLDGSTWRLLMTTTIGGQPVQFVSREIVITVNESILVGAFATWLGEHGLDNSNPLLMAGTDLDQDGHALIAEFVFGGDPVIADGSFVSAFWVLNGGTRTMVLSFPVYASDDSILLGIDVSNALGGWNGHALFQDESGWYAEPALSIEATLSPDESHWMIEIDLPVAEGEEALFSRLFIEYDSL